MKKRATLLIVLLFSFMLLSCSNIVSGEVYVKPSYAKKIKLDVSYQRISSYIYDSSRTIAPEKISSGSLKYYLYYIDTLSSSSNRYSYYGKVSLNYNSTDYATADVDFVESVYRFALYACETDFDDSTQTPEVSTVETSACLAGFTTADLRSADKIVFYLSESKLNSSGTVAIGINSDWTFSSDWQVYIAEGKASVSIGIYDVVSGSLVSSGGVNINPHILSYPSEVSNSVHLTSYGFGGISIPAGTYSFVVKFTHDVYNLSYEYSELLLVFPNRVSVAEINLPDVIEQRPTSPSAFTVAYTQPVNATSSFYLADFTWNDESGNETNFEIQFADISSSRSNLNGCYEPEDLYLPSITDNESWESEVYRNIYPQAITTYDEKSYRNYISHYYNYFEQSSDYSPEFFSLLRNNTRARFYLELGKRYAARIRAVNDAGKSDWVYLPLDSNGHNPINLFRITYYKNESTETSYHTQTMGGTPISVSDTSTGWRRWHRTTILYNNDGSSADTNVYPPKDNVLAPENYTGHENLILVGEYDGTENTPDEWAFLDGDIALYGLDSNENPVYFDFLDESSTGKKQLCRNGQYIEVKKSETPTLYWHLVSSEKNNSYSSVTLKLASTLDLDTPIYENVGIYPVNSWRTNVSSYANGYYIATFIAKTNEHPDAEFEFTLVFKLSD